MLLRGVARSPFDMRGFEWLPICAGAFFFLLATMSAKRKQQKISGGDLISLIFVCAALIASGVWAYFKDR